MREVRVLWYSVTDFPPPVGVVVLVIWDGRPPFPAARVAHPTTGRTAWLTHEHGRPIFLPCPMARHPDPRRPWAGWHTLRGFAPDLWRPQVPERWQMPLPAPAWVDDGVAPPTRLWSATQRFDAVEEATAAAREMEGARRKDGTDAVEERPDAQWWRDPHAVSYSRPGAISIREAEGRLMRAFATERCVRLDSPKLTTSSEVLARLAASLPLSPGDAAAADPQPEFLEPTGRDHDDMLTALGWLMAIGAVRARPRSVRARRRASDAERVLRMRAWVPPLTWARIGEVTGRSGTAARGLYRSAIADVALAANGGVVTPDVAAVMAEVRADRERLTALHGRARKRRGT